MTIQWPDVEGGTRAWLRADPDVAAIVDTRVFFGVPRTTNDATWPLVTVARVGGASDLSDAPVDLAVLQIDCWGVIDSSGNGQKAGATRLLNAVRTALDRITSRTRLLDTTATVDGADAFGVQVAGVVWLPDPDNDRPRYSITAEVTAIMPDPDPPVPPPEVDSFETSSSVGGAGPYWDTPAKLGLGFVANADVLVQGARWWRKATFSASNPVLYIGEPFELADASAACEVAWPNEGWETILFAAPVAVPSGAERVIWITTAADIDLTRDATYFASPRSTVPNGLITSVAPTGRFNQPKHSEDARAPDATADGVWYWLDPLVIPA